jgi:hypothetical protein
MLPTGWAVSTPRLDEFRRLENRNGADFVGFGGWGRGGGRAGHSRSRGWGSPGWRRAAKQYGLRGQGIAGWGCEEASKRDVGRFSPPPPSAPPPFSLHRLQLNRTQSKGVRTDFFPPPPAGSPLRRSTTVRNHRSFSSKTTINGDGGGWGGGRGGKEKRSVSHRALIGGNVPRRTARMPAATPATENLLHSVSRRLNSSKTLVSRPPSLFCKHV